MQEFNNHESDISFETTLHDIYDANFEYNSESNNSLFDPENLE